MLHEAGGEDAGGDRHGAHAQEGDDHPHDPPQERHRVNIPVANRKHGGNAPPDAGQGVFEHLRLGRVLRAVHAEGSGQDQHQDDKDRVEDGVLLFLDDGGDDLEGIVLGVDTKQMQDPRRAQDPKGPEPGQEEEGQDGEQVHDPVEGEQEPQHRPRPGIVRI